MGRQSSNSAISSSVHKDLSPRWLSEIKQRIGKCINFGLTVEQAEEAAKLLQTLAKDWRALLAGTQGYLVGHGHAGLERHPVAWGEMVGANGSYFNIWDQLSCPQNMLNEHP